MTKQVRVENADTSTYKVVVEVWSKQDPNNHVLEKSVPLNNPTDLGSFYIHSTQYLIVKEA